MDTDTSTYRRPMVIPVLRVMAVVGAVGSLAAGAFAGWAMGLSLWHGLVWAAPGLVASALLWAAATGLKLLHDIRSERRAAHSPPREPSSEV